MPRISLRTFRLKILRPAGERANAAHVALEEAKAIAVDTAAEGSEWAYAQRLSDRRAAIARASGALTEATAAYNAALDVVQGVNARLDRQEEAAP